MRKLKLQMQLTVDGFVAGPNGELNWMVWDWSDDLKEYVKKLTESIDLILMGRKMSKDFLEYWQEAVKKPEPVEDFANEMVNTPKIIFSKTIHEPDPSWINVTVSNGDLKEVVTELKNKPGKDIIVYGGANFVSQLIQLDLIDELHLFINPVAIGEGMEIFLGNTKLELVNALSFNCGVVLMEYRQLIN